MTDRSSDLRPGSLPFVICIILRRRRYRPIDVTQLTALTKMDAPQVSNALQRLQELGLARRVQDGWCHQRQRR